MTSNQSNYETKSDRIDKLIGLMEKTSGELTYIGRLALALPSSENWETIVDEYGNFLRAHYRGMSDEVLVNAVLWGSDAQFQFSIVGRWLKSELDLAEAVPDQARIDYLQNLISDNQANLFVADHYELQDLREELSLRRRRQLLEHGSNLEIEKLINSAALAYSGGLEQAFDRLGYEVI